VHLSLSPRHHSSEGVKWHHYHSVIFFRSHQNNSHSWGCSLWENLALFRWFHFEICINIVASRVQSSDLAWWWPLSKVETRRFSSLFCNSCYVPVLVFIDPRFCSLGLVWLFHLYPLVTIKRRLRYILDELSWWYYPIPSEGWGCGGTPQRPNSRATPQGLEQRSKMEEVSQILQRVSASAAWRILLPFYPA